MYVRENCLRHREVNAYIHVPQCIGLYFAAQLKHVSDRFALLACNRVDFTSHLSVADECDSHERGFRTSLSYRSMPSINSRLLIFSPAVCASRIEPGPISRRFPVFPRCGASLPNDTTVVRKPSTTCQTRGSDAPTISIVARFPTTRRNFSSTVARGSTVRIMTDVLARAGTMFAASPP